MSSVNQSTFASNSPQTYEPSAQSANGVNNASSSGAAKVTSTSHPESSSSSAAAETPVDNFFAELSLADNLSLNAGIQRTSSVNKDEGKREETVDKAAGYAKEFEAAIENISYKECREIAKKIMASSTPGKDLFDALRIYSAKQNANCMHVVAGLREVPNLGETLSSEILKVAKENPKNWANELNGRFLAYMLILCVGTKNEQVNAIMVLTLKLNPNTPGKMDDCNTYEQGVFMGLMQLYNPLCKEPVPFEVLRILAAKGYTPYI